MKKYLSKGLLDISMGRTIFFPPKHAKAAKMIRIDSPEGARQSVRWLSHEWRKAKRRDKKRRLIRYASLAKARAKVALKRRNLSAKERKEFKKVVKIYDDWLKKHRLR